MLLEGEHDRTERRAVFARPDRSPSRPVRTSRFLVCVSLQRRLADARTRSASGSSARTAVLNTTVLANSPISPSVSRRWRLATRVPTRTSATPNAWLRAPWNAARVAMKKVAPSRCATLRNAATDSGGTVTGSRSISPAPMSDGAGSKRGVAAPNRGSGSASFAFQYSSCATSAGSSVRCHRA